MYDISTINIISILSTNDLKFESIMNKNQLLFIKFKMNLENIKEFLSNL